MNFRSSSGQPVVPTPVPGDRAATAAVRPGESVASLTDVIFKLLIGGLLAYFVYDKVTGSRTTPVPASDKPDVAVVKLGGTYGRALLDAAAGSLESGSTGAWTNALEAKAANRKAFDGGIQAAMDPLAVEMGKRFGAADSTPMDALKSTALRKFWHDLALGIKG